MPTSPYPLSSGRTASAPPDEADGDATPDIGHARALHKQGRLSEAEPIYTAALERAPGHYDALRYLGELRLQQSRAPEAIDLLAAAPT